MLRKGRLLSKAAALTMCAGLLIAGLGIGDNSALAESEERGMVGNMYTGGLSHRQGPRHFDYGDWNKCLCNRQCVGNGNVESDGRRNWCPH